MELISPDELVSDVCNEKDEIFPGALKMTMVAQANLRSIFVAVSVQIIPHIAIHTLGTCR